MPRDYLYEATKTSEVVRIPIPGAPRQGYGYQFWIVDKTVAPQLGSTTGFAAVGYGAQSLVVVPGLDLVVVTRGQLTPDIAPADFWDLMADIVSGVTP